MSARCGDELICDFAETYHIYDWRGLPLNLAAILAGGLPEFSRSKMKLRGERATIDQLLLARICDLLADYFGAKTETGEPAPSLVKIISEPPKAPDKPKTRLFKSGAEFMKELNRHLEGGKNNG